MANLTRNVSNIDLIDWPETCNLVVVRDDKYIIGYLTGKPNGWRYHPFTSAHQSSRKLHPLPGSACRRLTRPSDKVMTSREAQDVGILKRSA